MSRPRLVVAVMLLIAITMPAKAADTTVSIENFTFKPAVLTVHAGTSVVFKNADDIPHSIVLTDGSFHSKALDTDDTVTVSFTSVGEHVYFCGLHPHMQGKIVVVP